MAAPKPSTFPKLTIAVAVISAAVGFGIGVLLTRQLSAPPPPVVAVPEEPPPTPPPPARVSYTAVDFATLPGWTEDEVLEAMPALRRSCDRMRKTPAERIVGDGDLARPAASWVNACASLETVRDASALREVLAAQFTAFAVSDLSKETDADRGTFTGYYEADLNGSFTREGPYQIPIYGPPRDLVTVNLKDFIPNADAFANGVPSSIVGRVEPEGEANRFKPYYTRADIDSSGAIADEADVIVWADDPVDVHILHIQGSGRVTLPDGQVIRIGFAGHNGRSFRGIGGILLAAGELKPGQGSMISVRKWLRENPQKAIGYMNENTRYIFFRRLNPAETESGPVGAQGVSLTPLRSLAVDPAFIPLGAPVWLDVNDPDGIPLQRLMVAQDVGSAIKGPVRGDFFWGAGDEAFSKAGRMKSTGRFFVMVPNVGTTDAPVDGVSRN